MRLNYHLGKISKGMYPPGKIASIRRVRKRKEINWDGTKDKGNMEETSNRYKISKLIANIRNVIFSHFSSMLWYAYICYYRRDFHDVRQSCCCYYCPWFCGSDIWVLDKSVCWCMRSEWLTLSCIFVCL